MQSSVEGSKIEPLQQNGTSTVVSCPFGSVIVTRIPIRNHEPILCGMNQALRLPIRHQFGSLIVIRDSVVSLTLIELVYGLVPWNYFFEK